jgi:hypothetical protein
MEIFGYGRVDSEAFDPLIRPNTEHSRNRDGMRARLRDARRRAAEWIPEATARPCFGHWLPWVGWPGLAVGWRAVRAGKRFDRRSMKEMAERRRADLSIFPNRSTHAHARYRTYPQTKDRKRSSDGDFFFGISQSTHSLIKTFF